MFKFAFAALAVLWGSLACALTTNDGVRINEINVAGPPSQSEQDGFVELYNAGSETAFLDGALVLQGVDSFAQLAFKFPGDVGGQTIAMPPGTFLVIATDAYNHAGLDPLSPNLTAANFETVVPEETPPADNSNVENMTDVLEINFDWFFVRRWGQVILATGEQWNFRPCQPGEACGLLVCQVPLETVVDGVEYIHHVSHDSLPILNDAIDRGFVEGVEPWSGQSIERVTPGQDTDDSSVDFRILPLATPGNQAPLAADRPQPGVASSPLLISAWPNPFNPDLNVQVRLEKAASGRLVVTDVLGREVALLHNGRLGAGENLFKWQANQVTSGTYWVNWTGPDRMANPLRVHLVR
jgi:hypothetical protein